LRYLIRALCFAPAVLATAVLAHHGWGGYDTDKPVYVTGKIVEVRWRNPHPQIVIVVTETPAARAQSMPVPPELTELGFGQVFRNAQPFTQTGRFELDLAPLGRLTEWGMHAAPKIGEQLNAIAFLSCTQGKTLRPSMIQLSDGRVVRQQSVALPPGCSGRPRG